MRWTSAIANDSSLEIAIAHCQEQLQEGLGASAADLMVVFASAHHRTDFHRLPQLALSRPPAHSGTALVGCSAGGVIGAGREVESGPALALAAASLPRVQVTQFNIHDAQLPDADSGPDRWQELTGVDPATEPHFVILADPMTIRGESLLMGLDFAYPMAIKVGGLASGGTHRGEHSLFAGDRAIGDGAVGVALSGDVQIDAIVAQGCRPIGSPLQVTAGGSNVLRELNGRHALSALREVLAELTERDRDLARHSLFLGISMDPLADPPQHGDFLIRNIIGVNAETGALGVAASVHEGQNVQFHLRDAQTSAADLRQLLTVYAEGRGSENEAGALMFSCLGRGAYLYGRPNHDTDMVQEHLGPLALTGFFCNGEIGPVGGTSFLHGYTTSLGLVKPRRPSPEPAV